MKHFILLLLGIIFSNMIFTQTFDISLNDIYSTDSLNAWIVGDEGTILHITDGGSVFADHSFPTSRNLHSICFVDEQRGFIVGDSGLILRTDNGGEFWNIVDLGVTFLRASVEFFNDQYGWITSWSEPPYSFLRTTDGGETWNTINTCIFETSFIDSLNGWGYSLGSISRTYDGGVNWTNISVAGGTGVSKIFFIDTLTGFKCIHAYGSFGSCVSHDGGYNWTVTNLGDDTGANDVYFLDAMNGWVCGSAIWYSDDLFETYDTFYGLGGYNSLSIHGCSNGWAVSSNGAVWKLEGLNNWVQIDFVDVHENVNSEPVIKCFPNPFSEIVHLEYEIENSSPVSIMIFNVMGEKVADLSDGILAKGKHQILWNAADLPAGLYFCTVQAGQELSTLKILKQ